MRFLTNRQCLPHLMFSSPVLPWPTASKISSRAAKASRWREKMGKSVQLKSYTVIWPFVQTLVNALDRSYLLNSKHYLFRFRGHARAFIKDLERIRPTAIIGIIAFALFLQYGLFIALAVMGWCVCEGLHESNMFDSSDPSADLSSDSVRVNTHPTRHQPCKRAVKNWPISVLWRCRLVILKKLI